MWGNLHGWVISAILAALILAPIVWLAKMSRVSPVGGIALDPANLAAIALPDDPQEAWPLASEARDAASDYENVMNTWDEQAQRACEAFVQAGEGEAPPVMQDLVDARHCARMALFSRGLSDLVNYDADHPGLDNLFAAGEWTYKAGLSLAEHGQTEQAKPYLEAAFALGRQLYQERVTYDEFQKGMELMDDAAEAMCRDVTAGSETYDRLKAFGTSLEEYQDKRIIPVWAVISSADQGVIEQSAGDVIAMAEQSGEHMWRVEATLKLGRYRFDAGTIGNRIGARRAVEQLAGDREAAVAMAAAAAKDLTLEKYRMIH
jgi:hypothetical protein